MIRLRGWSGCCSSRSFWLQEVAKPDIFISSWLQANLYTYFCISATSNSPIRLTWLVMRVNRSNIPASQEHAEKTALPPPVRVTSMVSYSCRTRQAVTAVSDRLHRASRSTGTFARTGIAYNSLSALTIVAESLSRCVQVNVSIDEFTCVHTKSTPVVHV